MSAPARLKALRLVGFKSFAERTVVEFGAGISAIVGPNGSGKSNLADALRWTLGEQGRLLRTRRSEDVIFAGSNSRRAIGMADVTLVIDNADRLLPLDYGEVEIGRRLYRSGENEYLLNRQRVRLRDLTELLDAANLADNAFLFIGQGMVDQALALRPEERRPLFEEAAGVRRHERRRRHAEAELVETAANLERLDDVLGELRPQARRLAAQAEQLLARRSAGLELAEALIATARRRWATAWQRTAEQQQALDGARARADDALNALRVAEELSEKHSRLLTERAEREAGLRAALEEQRGRSMELRLRQARLMSDVQALERERERLRLDRRAVEGQLQEALRTLGYSVPQVDAEAVRQLELTRRQLSELTRELLAAEDDAATSDLEQARLRRQRLTTELEEQRRRRQALEGGLHQATERLATAESRLAEAAKARDRAALRLEQAVSLESQREAAAQAARSAHEQALGRRHEAADRFAEIQTEVAAARARLAALEASLAAVDDDELLHAARRRGGELLAEGLEVEPALNRAVSAALGENLRAVVVGRQAIEALSGASGVLLVREAAGRAASADGRSRADVLIAAAVARGGNRLNGALRRDPAGHVTRLLGRVVWVPELGDALELASLLLPGWRVVTRAGEVLDEEGLLSLAGGEGLLEQRANRDEQARLLAELERSLAAADAELAQSAAAERRAGITAAQAGESLRAARRERSMAEEAERGAQRRADEALRQVSAERMQQQRLADENESLTDALRGLEAELAALAPAAARRVDGGRDEQRQRVEALHQRERQQRRRVEEQEQRVRAAEESRRRAEIGLALAQARAAEIDAERERLAGQAQENASSAERLGAELASAEEREKRTAVQLAELVGAEADDRRQLLEGERAAAEARERLRRAEADSRTAEVALVESRLQLEQVREQLLVELAGIGADGLAALRAAAPGDRQDREDGSPTERAQAEIRVAGDSASVDSSVELESALNAAVSAWSDAGGATEPPPNAARLATLRRRFHELGAGNPFAAEEYAEVRRRLEDLEAQRADVERAMDNARRLIDDLGRMIQEQFMATFAALEDAFARRFEQLFGGGEAQLSLTLPEDVSSTGVEITARPPGKKRQPLAMLSGGERALTAVALLLAMLEVRPVPFCVLDEVDAALDEANVSRFSSALRSLADQIQFIVITHNRGTIEAADALYGVTLGDDAVSRLVSLRLPRADANGRQASGVAIAHEDRSTELVG